MLIETWPIEKPVDYPKNARKWSPRAVDKVAASIGAYGWRQPIVVDKAGVIVIGHLRRLAGSTLGLKTCPVHVAADLTAAQIRGLRLADNRTNQESDWDLDLLGPELLELKAEGFDLTLTGFDSREIDGFTLKANAAEDEVPGVPEVPVSRLGDLWQCGPHRVLCGDATSQSDVTILLAGVTQPFLMVTDPPYGIELDAEWRDRAGLKTHGRAEPSYMKRREQGYKNASISGDTRIEWSSAFALLPELKAAYVWHASTATSEVLRGLLDIGFTLHQQIIWRKPLATRTRTHYWYQHEPCWYVRKSKAPWLGAGGTANATIWDAVPPKFIFGGSTEGKEDHPTQKPVELMRRPILNHLKPSEPVYDPFLGSGTTLAAAELTERVCYGLELDPKYVDVIVQRWQKLSGKEATLQTSSRTFEQEAIERGKTNRHRIQAHG